MPTITPTHAYKCPRQHNGHKIKPEPVLVVRSVEGLCDRYLKEPTDANFAAWRDAAFARTFAQTGVHPFLQK